VVNVLAPLNTHNLMDAISGIHGVEVSLKQLKRARAQLGVYLQKFKNRLKGKNRVYIAQVVRVIDSLAGYLDGRLGEPVTSPTIFRSIATNISIESRRHCVRERPTLPQRL
jgi:hypothetical protein